MAVVVFTEETENLVLEHRDPGGEVEPFITIAQTGNGQAEITLHDKDHRTTITRVADLLTIYQLGHALTEWVIDKPV